MIMRTTRNQRHKVHTKQTYSLKKLRTGKLVLALVGSFAVGAATIATSVNAAEWTARTVEEIKQDIGDFSKPYTIKWGDTLSAIQEATGIDYHKIAADNGIEDVNLIYAGNILYNKNGYTAVANVQTGEVKVYQAQTPTPTANTQAAVSNAVAKTVVKDVTDSKDEKVQEIKQELQQSVKSNGQVTDKNDTQTVKPAVKPAETSSQPVEQPAVKPVETPSQPAEKPAVKPAETPSQPVEQPAVKPVETPSQPVEQPTVKPAETPSQPVEQPAVKPVETPNQPVEQPAVKPVETPSQPAEQPAVKPAETPSQPAEQSAVKPAETPSRPTEQPTEQPAVKPAETPSQPIKPFKLSYEKKVVKSIPFEEEIFKDPKLDKGRIYREEGVEGLEEVIFEVEVENGKEIDYKEISRKTIKSAKNAVVHIGIFEGKIPHAINPEPTQPTQPVEQPAVKPVETPSQPIETTKPIETKVETEKGEPLVQPELPELVVETETVNHEIMFEETTQEDPELLEGNTRREEGVKGNEQVVFEIVKENGVAKSRTEISRKVTVAAKNAITYRGTKKATPEQPAEPEKNKIVIHSEVQQPKAGNVILGIKGEFLTPDKEAILNRINEIRKEAVNEGLSSRFVPIKWSTELEKTALIRAVESDITSDHKRLTDKKWISAFSETSKEGGIAENLAWNNSGFLAAIEQWYSEKEDFMKSRRGEKVDGLIGHYRSLISPEFKAVGLAAFKNPKTPYTVTVAQDFGALGESEELLGTYGEGVLYTEASASKVDDIKNKAVVEEK